MPRNRQHAVRDPRTGRFVPRGRAALVPRPDYSGVRVTGGTSVTPRDPGWRYGGPDWRFAGGDGPSQGQQARSARQAARSAPGTSLEARPTPQRGPGTSLVPDNPEARRQTYRQAAQRAGGSFGQARPGAARTAGRALGRASGPIGAGLLGMDLGGRAGTAAAENIPWYRDMIQNISDSPVGGAVGRLGAAMSGDFGSAVSAEGPGGTPTRYASREREAEAQLRLAQAQQAERGRPTQEEALERGRAADSARWQGQADAHFAREEEQQQMPQQFEDPYSEFLEQQMLELSGAYDAQIDAIGGLGDVFSQQAQEAQGNIGDFFGHAQETAQAGIPVTQEIYGDATQNVEGIYDDLGGRLETMPQRLTDIATDAAGGGVSGSVAGRVAEATAPFAAAGESARADATSNLAQHSAAGQNYLNQLASATQGESALHQSNVEQALNQQQQLIAHRQAELEGAKHRAMMEVGADIAGASAEQMGNMALSQALGLDLPGQVDPMDFLRAQGLMADMAPGEEGRSLEDEIDLQRSVTGLEQAEHNLAESRNPNLHQDQIRQNLSPHAQDLLPQLMEDSERELAKRREGGQSVNEQDRILGMLEQLDQLVERGRFQGQGRVTDALGLDLPGPDTEQELREAIRRLGG